MYVALVQCLRIVGINRLESEVGLDGPNLGLDRLGVYFNTAAYYLQGSTTYQQRSVEFHEGAILLNGQCPANSAVRLLACEPVSTPISQRELLALILNFSGRYLGKGVRTDLSQEGNEADYPEERIDESQRKHGGHECGSDRVRKFEYWARMDN